MFYIDYVLLTYNNSQMICDRLPQGLSLRQLLVFYLSVPRESYVSFGY